MDTLTLVRWCYADFGTFGRLSIAGETVYTVERAWLGNEPFVSCIPEGVYRCRSRWYYKGDYEAIEITQVPRRSAILIHKANWPRQLAGCVAPNAWLAPGDESCPMRGVNSREAFAMLMNAVGGRDFMLEIKGPERAVAPTQANGMVDA